MHAQDRLPDLARTHLACHRLQSLIATLITSSIDTIAAAIAAPTMGALIMGYHDQQLGVVGVQGNAALPLQGGPAPCPPWTEPPPV